MKDFRTIVFTLCLFLPFFPGLMSCSKSAPQRKTADQAVNEAIQGLASHQPRVLWDALPASYQKDMEDIVHELARKMDKDLWNKGFALADKAVLVLKRKKALLLASNMLSNAPVTTGQLSDNWDAVVGIAEVIAKSELADLEKLKQLDIRAFLSGTGAEFMKRLDALSSPGKKEKAALVSRQLKSVKTTVLQTDKDTARLKIEIPDEVSWEIAFVRVEGKWIPKPVADQWKTGVDRVKKSIAEWSTHFMAEEKRRFLGIMTSIDGILDQLLAAKSPQALESALARGFGLLLGMTLGPG
ncbi:MAG: hypothetical protein JRG88_12920 [Deltaproteobacteria bacterium]|nr:hypothetical protein [Deltaproteobacteria bacterium]